MTYYETIPSPIGRLMLVSDGDKLTGLHMEPHFPGPGWKRDSAPLKGVIEQLVSYFAGERRGFDVRLAPTGTPFQMQVWKALRVIPYGATATYGAIADRIGNPRAVRAVGRANGANPIAIIVPCHRVVGADGTLTGYGGGLDRKAKLLALEGLVFER